MHEIKKDLQAAKDECIRKVLNHVAKRNEEIRRTFVQTEILKDKLCDDKVTGWNNIVKECKQIEFSGNVFILVEEKPKDS